jgi:hypothetical protein
MGSVHLRALRKHTEAYGTRRNQTEHYNVCVMEPDGRYQGRDGTRRNILTILTYERVEK